MEAEVCFAALMGDNFPDQGVIIKACTISGAEEEGNTGQLYRLKDT